MTRTALAAFALLFTSAALAQTATAPAGQTPQPGAPSPATTPAAATAATPRPVGTPADRAATPGSAQQRTGAQRPQSNPTGSTSLGLSRPTSTAPLANSQVVISGSDSQTTKPSDDHPMLPMEAVSNPLRIKSGTPIRILLHKTADSGHVRNGDTLNATLAEPIAGLPKGTPVQLTVVQATQAGFMTSAGELSVQVTRIGNYSVLSEIVTALGKEGKREVADAAAATGTEAEFAAGQPFTFPAA